ncbi:MAG: hypothetical protein M3474_06290 [Actinomycetota bacterium]|nr:hypothetical protein [Actinomycetota bacterium]
MSEQPTTAGEPPAKVRRLDGGQAAILADLTARFDDLQTVLRCCEQLVAALSADGDPDDVVVEAVWTTALLSYARCFAVGEPDTALTESDLTTTLDNDEVLGWHNVLLQLRKHYADPSTNPRERFTVGVAQGADGSAGGVAITSARQPLVDDLTVRQTGAIAFALSGLVNDRIVAQQKKVFAEVGELSQSELDELEEVDLAEPEQATG